MNHQKAQVNQSHIGQAFARSVALALALVGTFLLLLGGCATKAPVDQIKYFSQAFVAVDTIGQPILDDLAVAERTLLKQQADSAAKGKTAKPCPESAPEEDGEVLAYPWAYGEDTTTGFIRGFCPSHASYYATIGEPPMTAELRRALGTIERFADVLSSLVDGRNVEQALGEVQALETEVSGLLSLVSSGAGAVLKPVLSAAVPALASAAKASNAAEARELVLKAEPIVPALIKRVREATPAAFMTLISGPERIGPLGGATPDALKAIELRRIQVSDYVTLLERLQKSWTDTVAAAKAPQAARLADLVAQTAELRANAEALRKTYAALRAGALTTK